MCCWWTHNVYDKAKLKFEAPVFLQISSQFESFLSVIAPALVHKSMWSVNIITLQTIEADINLISFSILAGLRSYILHKASRNYDMYRNVRPCTVLVWRIHSVHQLSLSYSLKFYSILFICNIRPSAQNTYNSISPRCGISLSVTPVALAPMLFHNYFLMTTTTPQLNIIPLSTIIFRTTDNADVFNNNKTCF